MYACGRGGAAGSGNAGDVPGVTCACEAPPVTFSPAPWQADGQQRTLDEALRRAIADVPGEWHGVATSPWVAPYEVSISFTAGGGYSGQCAWSSNVCCRAFYYGTDDDSSLKRYDLDQVSVSGEVSGAIDIIFGSPEYGYEPSGYQGEMRKVELDAAGNRLRFDFMYGGKYGPIHYDLERLTVH